MKREFDSLSIPAAKELMVTVLASGNRFRFTAHGISMAPFIRDGDQVEVASLTSPKVGQIVAASREDKLYVHRIVAKKADSFLLKGDHLQNPDGWFRPEELLGEIVAVYHKEMLQTIGVKRFGRVVAGLSKGGMLPPLLRIYAKIFKKVEKKS